MRKNNLHPKGSKTARKPLPRRGYRGMTAEQMDELRRTRLRESGLELFTTRGYANTTIEQLCRHSRVTSRYFYQLYESPEALLVDLFDLIIRRSQKAVMDALTRSAGPAEDRISDAISALIKTYLADERHARLCVIEAVGVSHALESRRRAVIHEFASMIKTYVDALASQNVILKRDYHFFSVAMVGGINELLADWLMTRNRPAIKEIEKELRLLFKTLMTGAKALNR